MKAPLTTLESIAYFLSAILPSEFLDVIIIERNYFLVEKFRLYLEACVESTTRLLPLHELAPIFDTTADYLGQLARSGKFEAKKRGQYWYASKEAVQQYFREANSQPRGRPRHKS